MTELERVGAKQPRVGSRFAGGLERDLEEAVGRGVAGVGGVHRRRGKAQHPQPARFPDDRPLQGMPLMRLLLPGCGAGQVHQQPASLHLELIPGYLVGFVARLALAGDAMKFPVMPGTHDEVAFEPAFAQRAADVVAHAGHRAENPILMTQCDLRAPDADLLQRTLPQVGDGAEILPVGLAQRAGAARRTAARKRSGWAGLRRRTNPRVVGR